ncbi:probable G-protein coupled receptor 160 [Brachyistius frenatus]|uniref:probable G-protein coupled receptor 160 n=1 Tax=Brachyistius frenatus TaxID=100188 RepID=UPI0037E976A6
MMTTTGREVHLEHLDIGPSTVALPSMLPQSLSSSETSHGFKMLAIIEQWEEVSGYHTDNTHKYLLLLLFKLGLDTVVFYLCYRKWYTSFLSMCSLSIILGDLVMTCSMAAVWFLGSESFFVSPCLLLANASATYGALPLPMMCLGLLDYCLEDTSISTRRAFCKPLRNMGLIVLVWILAINYAFGSVKAELMELDYVTGIKSMVCKVEESELINYFILGLFTAVLLTTLPFWPTIPQWVKEADRLAEAREEKESKGSDFLFTSTTCTETKCSEEMFMEETNQPRPPLWFSLILGFGMFWIPYLIMSVTCLVFGFGVPAYISVNLLWLECTNSLLVGMVFWVKSKRRGPYSHVPENICLWHVHWHLSKGRRQQQLPVAVFNPSQGKRNTFFYI